MKAGGIGVDWTEVYDRQTTDTVDVEFLFACSNSMDNR